MKIQDILHENYTLTDECNRMARYHTHEYYQFLVRSGAVDAKFEKGVLPYNAAHWQHECHLKADFIEDKSSNFYVVANSVSIEYRLEEVNDEPTTYQDYLDKTRKGIKTYNAHFDTDNAIIRIKIDPMLLDVREQYLQFIIYRILMHEISHVYHYSRTLNNWELGGKMPEQHRKYKDQSFEIDARYRDGWTEIFYYEKKRKEVLSSNEAWDLLRNSIVRNGAYKISPRTIEKYKKKFYQDYKEHLGRKQ